jgi:soluble lytic murein transglycosylase-like protein
LLKSVITLLLFSCLLGYAASSDTPDAAQQQALKQQRDSLDKQRLSVRLQLKEKVDSPAAASVNFIDPMAALPQADCDPLDPITIDSLISSAARRQSLEPSLLHAVMKQESGFKPCAVSIKGAQGLMQLMPATAQQLHVADPFDPQQNVQAGAAFLKQLLARYKGDLRLALVAYNAGTLWADQRDKDSYPAETQSYIAGIFAELGIGRAEPPDEPPAEPEDPPAPDQP